ncbi:MAG: hypothetical protein H6945_07785 [Zoogloeaceae bacterium]|nr:hypothetical protein [Rhodocyclaceae bacterium]MCP5235624.1 hypothetical protein [Zoogloeaceae bacterium]
MPNPIEILVDPINLGLFAAIAALIAAPTGFRHGASTRLADMLRARDVARDPIGGAAGAIVPLGYADQ